MLSLYALICPSGLRLAVGVLLLPLLTIKQWQVRFAVLLLTHHRLTTSRITLVALRGGRHICHHGRSAHHIMKGSCGGSAPVSRRKPRLASREMRVLKTQGYRGGTQLFKNVFHHDRAPAVQEKGQPQTKVIIPSAMHVRRCSNSYDMIDCDV